MQAVGKLTSTQTTLDNVLELATPHVISKDTILHAVSQLVACDDQVYNVWVDRKKLTIFIGIGTHGQGWVQELLDHNATQNKNKGITYHT